MIPYIIILSFESEKMEDFSEDVAETISKLNPTAVPGFTNQARIAIEESMDKVINYLDGKDE